MLPQHLITAFVFLCGACVGSFLNVVIHRLPRGESVVRPRSHCACGQMIAWYDNIPILSWFILRGRCRACGGRFSFRYPLVEALTAALWLAFWLQRPPAEAVPLIAFASLLIAASFIDLDTMEIHDRFSMGGCLLGFAAAAAVPSLHGYFGDLRLLDGLRALTVALQGAFIGSGLILWVALLGEKVLRREAMGFGDVKLMGAIGAFCGWQGAVFALFGGAILGTLGFALFLLCGGGRRREIPFGPALAAAALLYLLGAQPWVDAYFADISRIFFP